MPARLSLVAALPKLKHLTREEAAHRLGVTLEEFDDAHAFAPSVVFADPDLELPARAPTQAEREAARDSMPKRFAERQRKAATDSRKR